MKNPLFNLLLKQHNWGQCKRQWDEDKCLGLCDVCLFTTMCPGIGMASKIIATPQLLVEGQCGHPAFVIQGSFCSPLLAFTLPFLPSFPRYTSRYSVADCYISVCWACLSVTEGWEKWQGENKCLPFLFLLKFSSNKLAASENYLIPRSLGEIDIVNMSTREFCILPTRVLKPESVSSRLSCPEPH